MESSISQSGNASFKESLSKQKLELIQACRGFAALLVLFFHASEFSQKRFDREFLFNIFEFGKYGVDFFFVLSGFIIFFVHRYDIGRREKLKIFILKRFIRVYPMYWVITLILLPIYFMFPSFGLGHERNADVIIKSLLLFPFEETPVLVVGWTLSHEVFFYLMFGLAIFFKPKIAKKIIFGWLLGTFVLFVFSSIGQFNLKQYLWLSFIFDRHNLEFAFGCFAAYLISKHSFKQRLFLFYMGITLFILSGIAYDYKLTNINDVIAFGIPSMLIVIGAASLDIEKSVKLPRFFYFLGDASYSLYLTHYPCYSATLRIALAGNLMAFLGYYPVMASMIVIATVVGFISYLYVEMPLVLFLRKKLLSKICRLG